MNASGGDVQPMANSAENPVTKNGVINGKGIGFKYVGYGVVKYE